MGVLDVLPKVVEWKGDTLYLLDQTLLPLQVALKAKHTATDVWRAIQRLEVRGAPAIGVAAAYGFCVAAKPFVSLALPEFKAELQRQADYLISARPTAVNLSWAVHRQLDLVNGFDEGSSQVLYEALVSNAQFIHQQDRQLCEAIGQAGVALIKPGMGVLTHCNAGALATSGIGTATAAMYRAHAADVPFKVYADETRPLLQGARLTAWELDRAGIDVTLLCDSMAASQMAAGKIDLVIVGSDRVAANGDVANKIGTLGVALLAKHYDIPFYVAIPHTTFDSETECGDDVVIEQREAEEVTHLGGQQVGAKVGVCNPAFDVTPANLVAGFITDKGLVKPPFKQNLRLLAL